MPDKLQAIYDHEVDERRRSTLYFAVLAAASIFIVAAVTIAIAGW